MLLTDFAEGVGLCYWVWIAVVIYWSRSTNRPLYLLHNIRDILVLPEPLLPMISALGVRLTALGAWTNGAGSGLALYYSLTFVTELSDIL